MHGQFDLSKFDPYDSWAWKRLQLIITQLQQLTLKDVYSTYLTYYTSVLGCTKLSGESTESSLEHAQLYRNKLIDLLIPGSVEEHSVTKETPSEMYHRVIGAPGSPQHDAVMAAMAQMRIKSERQAAKV